MGNGIRTCLMREDSSLSFRFVLKTQKEEEKKHEQIDETFFTHIVIHVYLI